jgi:hypothetical protein
MKYQNTLFSFIFTFSIVFSHVDKVCAYTHDIPDSHHIATLKAEVAAMDRQIILLIGTLTFVCLPAFIAAYIAKINSDIKLHHARSEAHRAYMENLQARQNQP